MNDKATNTNLDGFRAPDAGDRDPMESGSEIVNDALPGQASQAQLEEAAAQLNAAADGPVAPQTQASLKQPLEMPPNNSLRAEIASRVRKDRMDEMVGHLPSAGDDQGPDFTSQEMFYGQYGDPNKNFMGENIAPVQDTAPEPVAEPQPTAAPEPEADAGERMLTVTVDGVQQQVRESDLIRNYQINSAADYRLKQASELLQQAQQNSVGTTAQASPAEYPVEPADSGQSQDGHLRQGPDFDAIDFNAIAEKVQLGEPEEGAKALRDLVEQVVQTVPAADNAPLNPALQVETVATLLEDRNESRNALDSFKTENPDIAGDDFLFSIATRHAVEAMVEDFAANGATPEQIDFAKANPAEAVNAHRAMRLSGRFQNLKSPTAIYGEAASRTRGWMSSMGMNGQGNPEPAVPQPQAQPVPSVPRNQRAQTAQQSPAVRSQPAAQPTPAPQVRSPSDVIAKMKQARGQFPAGMRPAA